MNSEIEEFWTMMQSTNDSIHNAGYRLWQEFAIKNPQYFTSLKEQIPKRFCETYQKLKLHDFRVLDIGCHSKQHRMTEIRLLLYDYHEDYGKNLFFNMIYQGVGEYYFSVKSTEFAMSWGYDIFEPLENGMLKHRILCSDRTSMEIAFKTISLIKVENSVESE